MAPSQIGLNLAFSGRITFAQLFQHQQQDPQVSSNERGDERGGSFVDEAASMLYEANYPKTPKRGDVKDDKAPRSPESDGTGTVIRIPQRRRNTVALRDFKASTARDLGTEVQSPNTKRQHRRTQSLKLPIPVHVAANSHHLSVETVARSPSPITPPCSTMDPLSPILDDSMATLRPIKHRRRNTLALRGFKASASRDQDIQIDSPNTRRQHRRTQSLKLPLPIHVAAANHHEDSHHENSHPECSHHEETIHTTDILSPASDDSMVTLVPIRQRRRNTSGLFKLKPSTSRILSPSFNSGKQHRRTQSLKLPLLVQFAAVNQHNSESDQSVQSTLSPNTFVGEDRDAAAQQQAEKELEFLHRNTFIGTASLDDFLNILDMSYKQGEGYITSIPKIIKAFTCLAEKEQITVRQQSQRSQGWELVRRIDPAAFNDDYLSQAHIKLGSVSLGQFLEYVGPITVAADQHDTEVSVMTVLTAFEIASKKDKDLAENELSKTKTFRRWMVSGKASLDG